MHGSCEIFCPDQEAKLRIKEKLLHFFELKNGQKNVPGILVKSFSRSAAGVKSPRSKDLRSERCLQKTIEYLLKDILLDKRKPYNFVYDFIFDRLRAVRQEMIQQNFNAHQTVRLLEPIIMFLAYSRYKLCEETVHNFDPKICEQHLQECLKRTLCCYDEIPTDNLKLIELKNRNFIEAVYQLFNLGSPEAFNRALTVSKDTRNDTIFASTFHFALSYHQGNIYQVLTGLRNLPHVLCAIASLKLQLLRRNLFSIFAQAYHSSQLTVPVDYLCRLTHHKNIEQLIDDCKYYKIKFTTDQKAVHFIKTDFKLDLPALMPKKEDFVEQKLQRIYLPEVLLLKKS